MTLTGLKEDALKLILFGGKGGVGKTTCATSTGLYLAKVGNKVLVISTDPAHSLSDSLGQQIGDQIKEVKGVKNLSALEINAQKALSQFKLKYEAQIKKIFDTSTYLDQEDINSIFALPIPGIDEVMGFKTIVDLIEQARFDKYIVETFSGKYNPDEGDDFLVEMKKTVKKIEGLLKDQNKCEFIAVTIPEDMAILETERLINNLNKYGIKVRQLVVNNVLELRDCEFCRERSNAQEEYIRQIRGKFSNLKTTIIPLQPREVKGIESLNNLIIKVSYFNEA